MLCVYIYIYIYIYIYKFVPVSTCMLLRSEYDVAVVFGLEAKTQGEDVKQSAKATAVT